jgi:hypothetical protein
LEPGPPCSQIPGEVVTYLRLREAKCRDGRVRGLADSEYTDTANSFSAGYNEANSVWSIGLHCGLSPDTAGPSLETPRSFHGHGRLYQWTRVAMGLKGSGPYFQRSLSNTVLAGLVYQICELYIDDVLIHGRDLKTFLAFKRLREFNIVVNSAKTKLGLAEVEYVGHVISATGTSFSEEKWLKVLQFPLPETQKICCSLSDSQTIFRIIYPT